MHQRIELFGRLGGDPIATYTANGKGKVNFSVACTEKYNGNEDTTWFNCTAWGKTGEIASKYLKKGDRILVTDGRIGTWKHEERHYWGVTVLGFKLVEQKRDQPAATNSGQLQGDSPSEFGGESGFGQ